MKHTRKILAAAVAGVTLIGLTACSLDEGPQDNRETQAEKSKQKFEGRTPPQVTGDAEYQNYIKAQEEVYDDPANIIWCTGTIGTSADSPIFTVPIAGKLTSSSVSYYPGSSPHEWGNSSYGGVYLSENQSVDGMYHGSPPPYRYGFTPGGQYVEFANIGTFCTTALTKFQKDTLKVSEVVDNVTKKAEQQLKDGDKAGAQKTVDSAAQ